MSIENIGNVAGRPELGDKPPVQANGLHGVGRAAKADDAEEGAAAAPLGTPERSKGVIRLLQEGHFKGVADVRLRINFADELSALEHASVGQAVEDAAPALVAVVNEALDGLVASDDLDEGQIADVESAREVFVGAVDEAVTAFSNSAATNTNSLREGLQTAFNSLVETLTPLLTALTSTAAGELAGTTGLVPDEPPVGTEGEPVVVETEAASALSTFLDDLTETFDAALVEFQGVLDSASMLPTLSEPTGNGAAYAKFLAMYNDLNGISGAAGDGSGPPDGLDTIT